MQHINKSMRLTRFLKMYHLCHVQYNKAHTVTRFDKFRRSQSWNIKHNERERTPCPECMFLSNIKAMLHSRNRFLVHHLRSEWERLFIYFYWWFVTPTEKFRYALLLILLHNHIQNIMFQSNRSAYVFTIQQKCIHIYDIMIKIHLLIHTHTSILWDTTFIRRYIHKTCIIV